MIIHGGDKRHLPDKEYVDLSTCVNRNGPPPAVLAKLQSLNASDLLIHPYDAAVALRSAYADVLNVPLHQLIAGRGTTEFIWSLARRHDGASLRIPTPNYSDYFRAAPQSALPEPVKTLQSGRWVDGISALEQLDQCMRSSKYVLTSNPNNPTGFLLPRDELQTICAANQDCVLVVDESYMDFLPDHNKHTLIGSNTSNVIVLRAPSKFYGIASTRVGIAWSLRTDLLKQLFSDLQDTWPISGIDTICATAALASVEWANEQRNVLKCAGIELENMLSQYFEVHAAADVHFRFAYTRKSQLIQSRLLEQDIIVRAFHNDHGVARPGVRITAPLAEERSRLEAALKLM